MLPRAWKLIVLLALLCGPLAVIHAQPLQAMDMADCGEMPVGHSGKSTALGHCIAGCAFVIPLDQPMPVNILYAEETFELPAKAQIAFLGDVATPPPK
jgi:hypothetical protein